MEIEVQVHRSGVKEACVALDTYQVCAVVAWMMRDERVRIQDLKDLLPGIQVGWDRNRFD